jgi:mono/diheme cytochrome c family protein
MTRVASADGVSVEALETGRRLLAMRCAGCHSLEPVANYTPREWKDNVRDMADRSGLNPEEEQQIVEYLSAARKSLDLELDPSSR